MMVLGLCGALLSWISFCLRPQPQRIVLIEGMSLLKDDQSINSHLHYAAIQGQRIELLLNGNSLELFTKYSKL
uniref:Putative secreted protein n=1 Tax=Anopheles darlingi TaxID=43151 RepID=A0A2M4D813_ANODA